MFIIVAGNPVNGLSFWGPYPDSQSAIRDAEAFGGYDWWIGEVEPPLREDQ